MTDERMPSNRGNCNLTLVEYEGEPRVRDVVLGKVLGMARPRKIRELIERHMHVLLKFGTCPTMGRVERGNEVQEYQLNEEQAVYIVTQSDAPNALETKVMVVKVFVAWRHGHLAPAAILPEEVRRTDGISRMLAHKVTGIERDVGDIGRAVIELAQEVKALVIASDPRMGAVTSVPALQIAIEQGVKKRPRGLSLLIGNALARYCEGKKEFVVHRDIYDRRLFPRAAVNEWIAQGGWGPIKDTIDRKGGQGVFRLIPIKQAKPATPEARP